MEYFFDQAELGPLTIHYVGNPTVEGYIQHPDSEIQITDDTLADMLKHYFFSHFKQSTIYRFAESGNAVVQQAVEAILEGESLLKHATNMAQHLFEQSNHPAIKTGELYVVKFAACVVDGETCEAIGLFKSENKDKFIKVYQQGTQPSLLAEEGININKLDKGCIIFNVDAQDGYRALIVDHVNRSDEARYWKEHFLGLQPIPDHHFHTENMLKLCQQFSNEIAIDENDNGRHEQLLFRNRTAEFFKQRETFKQDDFEEVVLETPEAIDAFREYKREFQERQDIQLPDDSFELSEQALKKSNKFFKSILKLDKNFHVYVHGSSDMMEKGYDEMRGKNYYKLFFDKES